MATRDLLSGPVTLSDAKSASRNYLHAFKYPQLREEFYQRIESYVPLLREVVAHHLRIKASDVTISPREYWRHGSFNLLVPIAIDPEARWPSPALSEFVSLRFPLPYRVGEMVCPGNADEKVNCEAATYAWIQGECPDVPIPKLYGFGMSTGERFTNINFRPWWTRYIHLIHRQLLRLLGLQLPSQYIPHHSHHLLDLDIGYLLIQTITNGQMLSETWDEKHEDSRLQNNLQRDLARIMLSLASIPLPRIGAFRIDHKGYLRLDNRPLSIQGTMQENEGIPLDLSRSRTFSRVDEFVLHYLDSFDNRFLHQPNAIRDETDAWSQMTGLAVARSVFPRLFRREFNEGPFVYALTDLHRSNIFVDEGWNVTCIIDLEFACSLPVEFLGPPYWLSGKFVDEMRPKDFEAQYEAFVEHVKCAKEEQSPGKGMAMESLSSVMKQAWTSGAYWAKLAVEDPMGFTGVFYYALLPFYFGVTGEDIDDSYYRCFSRLWRPGVSGILEKKLEERKRYDEQLRVVFAESNE